MGKRIDELRNDLMDFFEKKINPLITEDNKDQLDIFFKVCERRNDNLQYVIKWYDNTLRLSARCPGVGMQFFFTGTIPGKEKYLFNGPVKALNEV